MEKLLLGYILGSFSLDGTLKILSKTNFFEKRYKKGNKVSLFDKEENLVMELTVSSFRHSGEFDFVKFEEINSKEIAESYKGYALFTEKTNDLEEGMYYYSDLEGCTIVSNEKVIGKVIKVEEFPAQVTLRAKDNNGKEFFVPFVKAFIKKVSIEEKEIEINLWEGML